VQRQRALARGAIRTLLVGECRLDIDLGGECIGIDFAFRFERQLLGRWISGAFR
jgi:hypothetical protein